ncbi:MAG: helix-turn-helix domain-containing protein [Myxococcaceae bacterium]
MDYADFGKYIVQQRELRGMSRDDVVTATRIPMSVLIALESGDVAKLPARVFVVNYIKAYARVIGLSPEEAVLRYEEVDSTVRDIPPPAALERERTKTALWKLVLVGIVVLALGYGVLIMGGQVQAPWSR